MIAQGIHIHFNSAIGSIEGKDGNELHFYCSNGLVHKGYDCLLSAVGHVPLTRNIGIETAGVELTREGHIVVDAPRSTAQDVCPLVMPPKAPPLRRLRSLLDASSLTTSSVDTKTHANFMIRIPSAIFFHPHRNGRPHRTRSPLSLRRRQGLRRPIHPHVLRCWATTNPKPP